MNGWIKLHRQMRQWEWSSDPNMLALFVHLLLRASNRDTKWRGIDIKRGQAIIGLRRLSQETGISIQTIRTCLGRLERSGEITRTSTHRFTLISICNYILFQGKTEHNQHTGNTLSTHSQHHREKVKNIEKYLQNDTDITSQKNDPSRTKNDPDSDPRFIEFWQKYPRKVNRPAAHKAWTKVGCGNSIFEEVIAGLERYINGPWRDKDKRYIPYASTWINGEGWLDEIDDPKEEDGWML